MEPASVRGQVGKPDLPRFRFGQTRRSAILRRRIEQGRADAIRPYAPGPCWFTARGGDRARCIGPLRHAGLDPLTLTVSHGPPLSPLPEGEEKEEDDPGGEGTKDE